MVVRNEWYVMRVTLSNGHSAFLSRPAPTLADAIHDVRRESNVVTILEVVDER